MDLAQLSILIQDFDRNEERRSEIERVRDNLKDFLRLYPFASSPQSIDTLTPDQVYKKGEDQTFFYWIERKLRVLGHITVYANWFENARSKTEIFKGLLRDSLKEGLPLSQRVDHPWDSIGGFGGDRTIAKKIISLYYSENVIPIFKTEDMERFLRNLAIDFEKKALSKMGTPYDVLSVGQKFELLNGLLLDFKRSNETLRTWDNARVMEFLYENFPSPEISTAPSREVKAFHPLGLLFEPTNEQEVLYLFALLHRQLGFPYVVKIGTQFPDAEVMDEQKKSRRVEFELYAGNFIEHEHPLDGCDFVVCWENNLAGDSIPEGPRIVSLKEKISEIQE
jgi:hypothetical protein